MQTFTIGDKVAFAVNYIDRNNFNKPQQGDLYNVTGITVVPRNSESVYVYIVGINNYRNFDAIPSEYLRKVF